MKKPLHFISLILLIFFIILQSSIYAGGTGKIAGKVTDAETGEDLIGINAVSYTHLRAHETVLDIVCRLLLEKKKKRIYNNTYTK